MHRSLLLQFKNGPCGLIASIQARIFDFLRSERALVSADMALVEALARTLEDAGSGENQRRIVINGMYLTDGDGVLRSVLASCLPILRGERGLSLFLLWTVATRGVEVCRREMEASTSNHFQDRSLVAGRDAFLGTAQVGFCTAALVNLCLVGVATFDVHRSEVLPTPSVRVGLIAEEDNVCKPMKYPDGCVWVLLWGGHYTSMTQAAPLQPEEAPSSFVLYHYNQAQRQRKEDRGPSNPSLDPLSQLRIQVVEAEEAEEEQCLVRYFITRRKTRIQVIFERDCEEGAVGSHKDEEDGGGRGTSDGRSEGNWYCAPCYTKGVTFAPNWNSSDSRTCNSCGLENGGRSRWIDESDLPAKDRRNADEKFASTAQRVIWRQWPKTHKIVDGDVGSSSSTSSSDSAPPCFS